MAAFDNTYSRLVALLKVLLPLIALAMLSTLFLISQYEDPSQPLPFADLDIEGLAREQRIGNPTVATVSEDGSTISVVADNARPIPDKPGEYTIDHPALRIEGPTGTVIEATGRTGRASNPEKKLTVTGDAVVTTSAGYRLQAAEMTATYDRSRMTASGQVYAEGPLGTITAEEMVLQQQATDDGTQDYVLVFSNGVKLVYDPNKQ